MALELNGTTGVSLVQDGVVATADIADGAVTDAKITGMASSKLSGALPALDGSALTGVGGGLPDVLLNYAGNTLSIRASSGVSSVTYNGSGDNTINFSTSFANSNYYVSCTVGNGTAPNDFQGIDAFNPSSGSIRVYTCYVDGIDSSSAPHNVTHFYLAIWSS